MSSPNLQSTTHAHFVNNIYAKSPRRILQVKWFVMLTDATALPFYRPLRTVGPLRRRNVRNGDCLQNREEWQTADIDQPNRIGRDVRYAYCDFLAKKYKTEYRTSTNRTESVEMCDMHLVIFLAKKYKTEYRTSTNRTESVGRCAICIL